MINIKAQTLTLTGNTELKKTYKVSTAKNGPGEIEHSQCTPRGRHRVHSKIGGNAPINSVFVGRQWTGEIYTSALHKKHPERDWILTRIIRLSGLEEGYNKGANVDTLQRYIYIHGTPSTTILGKPGSHGCIRMDNNELIEIFEEIDLNTAVEII